MTKEEASCGVEEGILDGKMGSVGCCYYLEGWYLRTGTTFRRRYLLGNPVRIIRVIKHILFQ